MGSGLRSPPVIAKFVKFAVCCHGATLFADQFDMWHSPPWVYSYRPNLAGILKGVSTAAPSLKIWLKNNGFPRLFARKGGSIHRRSWHLAWMTVPCHWFTDGDARKFRSGSLVIHTSCRFCRGSTILTVFNFIFVLLAYLLNWNLQPDADIQIISAVEKSYSQLTNFSVMTT